MISLTLPFPPSVNHLYEPKKINGKNTIGKSAKAKAYEKECWYALGQQGYYPNMMNRRSVPDGPLTMMVTYYVPDRRKRDLDNLQKAALDLISSALGFDDSEIETLALKKFLDRDDPRCEVVIWPADTVVIEPVLMSMEAEQ